jgi:hypothetical protein
MMVAPVLRRTMPGLSVKEVLQDEKGFGADTQQKVPVWFASDGGRSSTTGMVIRTRK